MPVHTTYAVPVGRSRIANVSITMLASASNTPTAPGHGRLQPAENFSDSAMPTSATPAAHNITQFTSGPQVIERAADYAAERSTTSRHLLVTGGIQERGQR
jgi:hypothetical protein